MNWGALLVDLNLELIRASVAVWHIVRIVWRIWLMLEIGEEFGWQTLALNFHMCLEVGVENCNLRTFHS